MSYLLGAFNLVSRGQSGHVSGEPGFAMHDRGTERGVGWIRGKSGSMNVICRDPRKNYRYAGFQRSAHSAYRYREI